MGSGGLAITVFLLTPYICMSYIYSLCTFYMHYIHDEYFIYTLHTLCIIDVNSVYALYNLCIL